MSHFMAPKHVYIGKNALEEAKELFLQLGRKAFIVTGQHVGKSPMYQKLTECLKEIQLDYVTFDGITGEPTDVMIQQGVTHYLQNGCDFCIGIGGGSPLDSAKAIAFMSTSTKPIEDFMGKELIGEIPPIVAIPTTSGTGSEATKFTVITDEKSDVKMLLKGDCLIPTVAIIDPDFSMDMPKSVTAATGLDAFTHAIEAYTSKKAFSLTDTYAISAIKRIFKYLPQAYENGYNAKAREEMSIAAFEAGICINNSSVTLVHGMSRPIGALFHVPHGLSNAMLLADCMEFAMDGAYEQFATLARECNLAEESDLDVVASEKLLKAIRGLCKACEVTTLAEYGILPDRFSSSIEKMAEDAIASGSPANTRKEVTKQDCMALYQKVYENKMCYGTNQFVL